MLHNGTIYAEGTPDGLLVALEALMNTDTRVSIRFIDGIEEHGYINRGFGHLPAVLLVYNRASREGHTINTARIDRVRHSNPNKGGIIWKV